MDIFHDNIYFNCVCHSTLQVYAVTHTHTHTHTHARARAMGWDLHQTAVCRCLSSPNCDGHRRVTTVYTCFVGKNKLSDGNTHKTRTV